jgi:hypothetical protein
VEPPVDAIDIEPEPDETPVDTRLPHSCGANSESR